MEDKKFKQIMEAIQTTKSNLKADFNDQMVKLKQDVTASQECSSQEVVKKLNKRVYQFRRKGNEAQYAFNSTVEEHMSVAKKELAKLPAEDEQEKAVVKRLKTCLDEGIKAIEVRQKHIKIADRLELG